MKKTLKTCLMIALVIIMTAIPVISNADAVIEGYWDLAYDVDYDVVVTAPDGGVNLRMGPGAEYDKAQENMIKNGTELHIMQETRAENGKLWGYTCTDITSGWVFLGQCTKTTEMNSAPADTPDSALDSVADDSSADADSANTDVFGNPEEEAGVMKIDAADGGQPAASGTSNMTTMILVIIALLIIAVIVTAVIMLKKTDKKKN